ncbi:ERAD-associated protein, partial [Ascosphaera atra]
MVFPESRPFTELGFWEMLQKIVSEGLKLIIFNSPRSKEGQSSRAALEKNPKLLEASRLLESAASRNNRDAQYVLAEMNFHGNWTYPRNYSRAFQLYDTLATSTGNSTAQYMLGFMYATGIGGAVERDQGKALLYHTFAAMNGNIRSEMSVAYRKYVGIGTPRDCDSAVLYYKKVADRAMEYYRSGPPGGRVLPKDSYRWADEEGGVYGEGSYYSKYDRHGFKGTDASMEDVIEYLDLLAKKGEVIATYSLGKMYYEGSLTSTQNMRQAM